MVFAIIFRTSILSYFSRLFWIGAALSKLEDRFKEIKQYYTIFNFLNHLNNFLKTYKPNGFLNIINTHIKK